MSSDTAPRANWRGARGRSGGRGRGRGPGFSAVRASGGWDGHESGETAGGSSVGAEGQKKEPKPRLTHFVALPIGHLPALRARMTAFTAALLAADPPISGLDPSIVRPPASLHLTLGVMSLLSEPRNDAMEEDEHKNTQPETPKTVEAAVELLTSLRPRILELLNGRVPRLAVDRMDIMPAPREKAHVLWVGPEEGAETARLRRMCELIRTAFVDAGLMVDEKRPLKLHVTILNTVHRKPRRGRTPFSYAALLSSTATQPFLTPPPASPPCDSKQETVVAALPVETLSVSSPPADASVSTEQDMPTQAHSQSSKKFEKKNGAVVIDFGSYPLDRVQICAMGKHEEDGAYVSCGGIELWD